MRKTWSNARLEHHDKQSPNTCSKASPRRLWQPPSGSNSKSWRLFCTECPGKASARNLADISSADKKPADPLQPMPTACHLVRLSMLRDTRHGSKSLVGNGWTGTWEFLPETILRSEQRFCQVTSTAPRVPSTPMTQNYLLYMAPN